MSSITNVYSPDGLTSTLSPPIYLNRDPNSSDLDFVPGQIIINKLTNTQWQAGLVVNGQATFINLSAGGGGGGSVSQGGTGLTALVPNEILIGGITSTSAMQQIPLGASGTVLTSTGISSAPTFQTGASAGVSSVIGSGTSTKLTGDISIVGTNTTGGPSTIAKTIITSSTGSTLTVSSSPTSFLSNIKTISTSADQNYSINPSQDSYINVTLNSPVTILLPDSSVGLQVGQTFTIQLCTSASNSGISIVTRSTSEKINGLSSFFINVAWEAVSLVWDGSNFFAYCSTGVNNIVDQNGQTSLTSGQSGLVGFSGGQFSASNPQKILSNIYTSADSTTNPGTLYIYNTPATYAHNYTLVGNGTTQALYNALITDTYIFVTLSASAGFNVTLPAYIASSASSVKPGQIFMIKDVSGRASGAGLNQLTITSQGATTIDSSTQTQVSITTAYGSKSFIFEPTANRYYVF